MISTAKGVFKRKLRRGNSLETRVDFFAILLLIVFVIISLCLLLTFTLAGLVGSVSTLMTGFFQWLILRCVAEHLRLQKMIADLPFEGNITGPIEEEVWCCSKCGYTLQSITDCNGCGAKLES